MIFEVRLHPVAEADLEAVSKPPEADKDAGEVKEALI